MKLGEMVSLVRGNTYKSSLLSETDGPVLLGLGSIERGGGFKRGSWKRYPGYTDIKILLHPGDIYVSLKDLTQSCDLLGAVSRVPDDLPVGRLTQDTVKLEFNSNVSEQERLYVYWSLRTPQYRAYCKARGTGTTNMSLSRADFLAWELPPRSPVRDMLIALFELIDKKNELNNQLNGYLVELINSEFAKRFDNHGPKTPLKNVLSISTKSLNPQQHVGEVWEHYSIPAFDATHWPTFELADGIKSNKYAVDNNSILISKLNPSIKRMWVPACLTDKAVCSTEFIVYKPLESSHKSFYCAAINAEEFTAFLLEHVTGSTGSRQRTQPKATHNYPMPNPSRIEIESFCAFADPIYQQIQANEIESQRLRSLRDALLPKLMSGEIDVSKVDLTQLNSHLADC